MQVKGLLPLGHSYPRISYFLLGIEKAAMAIESSYSEAVLVTEKAMEVALYSAQFLNVHHVYSCRGMASYVLEMHIRGFLIFCVELEKPA